MSNIDEELKDLSKRQYAYEEALIKVIDEKQEKIKQLREENERLKEQNNDLRKIYRNTYQRLFDNGNDELARYFQAQIDECPTFYVEPIIDYHKEWKDYKSRNEKAIEYVEYHKFNKFGDIDCGEAEEIINILQGDDKSENN